MPPPRGEPVEAPLDRKARTASFVLPKDAQGWWTVQAANATARVFVQGTTDLTFDKAVTTRYVLVWITGLVPVQDGAQADLAEVTIHAAG